MLKILYARLQQYMNRELPDVQAGFRKGRGSGDQIANVRWIMEKASRWGNSGNSVRLYFGAPKGKPKNAQTTTQLHSSHTLVK